jgi:hypothetical protein
MSEGASGMRAHLKLSYFPSQRSSIAAIGIALGQFRDENLRRKDADRVDGVCADRVLISMARSERGVRFSPLEEIA